MSRCPLCRRDGVVTDLTCDRCGSLEGMDLSQDIEGVKGRVFAYPWSKGFVAPFLGISEGAVVATLNVAFSFCSSSAGTAATVVDLGCGDGRVCHIAARMGAKFAAGFDLDEALVETSTNLSVEQKVSDRTEFAVRDLFEVDLAPFSVICMFLLPPTLSDKRLVTKLRQRLAEGAQVVCFGWPAPALLEHHDDGNGGDDRGDVVVRCVAEHCSNKNSGDGEGLLTRWHLYRQQ